MKEQHLAESNNYQTISGEIMSEYVAGAVEMEHKFSRLKKRSKIIKKKETI